MQLDSTIPDYQEGEFTHLRRELQRRMSEFPKRFSLIAYVLAAIVILGGLGIWTELVKIALTDKTYTVDGLFTAATTFYTAVGASATYQLHLIATGNSDRVLTAFSFLTMALLFAAAVLLTVFRTQYPIVSLIPTLLLPLVSIWVWVVANADDPIYKPVSVDAASGGSTSQEPKGDLSEFKAD
ncbi:MAG: hypothetical protein OXU70_18315 [Gammaproteobacteria bacterium]|nr:hypothetical protein [Gammaproteobacteria bacterium]